MANSNADISQELARIMNAVYGEEVRGSIHDALETMNDQLNDAIDHQVLVIDNTLTQSGQAADASRVGGAIASIYSTSASYATGDYCLQSGVLYKCIASTSGAWDATKWLIVNTTDDFAGIKGPLSHLDGDFLSVPCEVRLFGAYRPGTVKQYTETYEASDRAILPLGETIRKNKIHISNPDGYAVSVYYRSKSDNAYVDYAQTFNTSSFITITVDSSQYLYFVMVKTSDSSNWTSAALSELNQRLFIYSGDYVEEKSITKVKENLDLIASDLNQMSDNLTEFEGCQCNMPYEKRIIGPFRAAVVGTYEEEFSQSGRAVLKINSYTIDGDVHIYNPDNYWVSVYKRKKSDNEYSGYVFSFTQDSYCSFTPDATTYDYYVMLSHRTGSSETNWTDEELYVANRRIYIYSGVYINQEDNLHLSVDSNLVKPELIHIGKYYYGVATPAVNDKMAYTDLIAVKEYRKYYFPFLTLGYTWFGSDQTTALGGNYTSRETVSNRDPYLILEAPAGAAYIGVSVRAGDIPNMILSELPDSKSRVEKVSVFPVAASRVVREPLNWLYDMDFVQSMAGSRIASGGSNVTFDGEKCTLGESGSLLCADQVCMDKSKICVIFSIPNSGTPEFVIGCNGYYAYPSLSIADGAIGVKFLSDGATAEVRMGTGNNGVYETLKATLDVSGLNIHSGRKIAVSIEKDTINKWIISIYDALTPNSIVTETLEATPSVIDENLYSNQIRGWGGPYVRSFSGSICVYRIQMYSTSPTYPRIAVWGDSYVENCGRNPDCGYGYLIRKELDGNVFLSGRGGATAEQASRRVAVEINACSPQYIIFNVGVNDSFGVTVSTFKTQLGRLIDMAEAKGAEPILITVPRINNGTTDTLSWVEQVNPWVRSLGYRYIDVAYALSTGDGTTQDYSKFVADKIHPNLAGGRAIFNYIKAFLPDLLWK